MGLNVRAVRCNLAPHDLADEMYQPEDLVKACKGADYIACTLPLTPATANMVGAAALDALKDGGGVINIGRSPVMDYAALVERLDSGKLYVGVLDVFATEPLPAYDPL
jgi:glyoxylate/hydroxypyruvate reductase A